MQKTSTLTSEKIQSILGDQYFDSWLELENIVDRQYEILKEWHTADRGEAYELKFRIPNRTLVSMFPSFPIKNKIGVMIIFGKNERAQFEENKRSFSPVLWNNMNRLKLIVMANGLCFLLLQMIYSMTCYQCSTLKENQINILFHESLKSRRGFHLSDFFLYYTV